MPKTCQDPSLISLRFVRHSSHKRESSAICIFAVLFSGFSVRCPVETGLAVPKPEYGGGEQQPGRGSKGAPRKVFSRSVRNSSSKDFAADTCSTVIIRRIELKENSIQSWHRFWLLRLLDYSIRPRQHVRRNLTILVSTSRPSRRSSNSFL
jgi:hypothetical protein